MAEIINRKKALAVSPLKASQTMGGALAILGLARSMPLLHGSAGCTAFAKVFFVRHFREPVPLQTTAMDQVSSVMGADDNIVEALKTICEKQNPAVIGLLSTALAETQGCDLNSALHQFRREHPEFKDVAVVAANTPDFSGSFESGFAATVKAIVETLVPERRDQVGQRPRQVNVLCSANLTPGDLEFVAESIESFGLRPLLIPDLSGSLDGHLDDAAFNPLTTGGLTVAELASAGQSIATLVVGQSLAAAADALAARTGVPERRFGLLLGLDAVDEWLLALAEISGNPVPERWQKQRRQLQDAMLDTHFMLGDARMAIAADPDLLLGFDRLLRGMGARTVAAVVPARSPALAESPLACVQVGDLEDLEQAARAGGAQLILGNSHALASAERLDVPLLRMGFPQYDLLGGFQRCWSGYRATAQALFDLANLLVGHHQGIAPYHSIYAQKPAGEQPQRRH
ncbi:nitrogenase iron-molybdenum cofactor biosynthesis protein NifN [Pseudomonas sp. GCM10022188]|uniref:nitrogenase iron-molybdenum cofactor biosynthesis protein NifN n=1 Tax=Pseudomonas TaxID=286 RepID=UPI001E654DFA|nr:nitrogenase iron-molybdenum cofactor biosynthesis protein NifN [Pseudomonas oryzagri]MCC6076768.1 nitrogenase iron-molybdenum cofactor biosynthesis protein NifN [Pseudomonas oryzagri]